MTKSTGKRAKRLSDGVEAKQAVNWAFTFYYEEEEALALIALKELPFKACQFVREICPTTGTRHLQGVVIFETKVVRSTVQKAISPLRPQQVSTKPCYASLANNMAYTSKDKTREADTPVYVLGSFMDCQENEASTADSRADELLKLAATGDWSKMRVEHPAAYLYNLNKLKAAAGAEACHAHPDQLEGVLDNYWIYGEAGLGKDMLAREMAPGAYSKPGNTIWWQDYMGQKDVILRDVGQSIMRVMDDFKDWTDRYKFACQTKGGGFDIRPTRILVTSNLHPRQLRGLDAESLAALERRFQFIEVADGKQYWEPRVNTERPAPLTKVLGKRPLSPGRAEFVEECGW